jgi:hypothetical protein
MSFRIALLVAILMLTPIGFAGTAERTQLDKLAWLTGCWKGTGLGGEVAECWLRSPDDKYTGVFHMSKNGQQQFSEIVMIAEFAGKFGYRVKHFDPSFRQWESDQGAGVTFAFVEMGENYIQFEGLRYELIEDICYVTLDMKKGNAIQQHKFVYTRM